MTRGIQEVIYVIGHGHGLSTHALPYAVPREYDTPKKLTVFEYHGNHKDGEPCFSRVNQWIKWSGKHPAREAELGKPTVSLPLLDFLRQTLHPDYQFVTSAKCNLEEHPSKETSGTVVDLYRYVAGRPTGSVASLQFFSHSTRYGPVFNNTFERDVHNGGQYRDPCDIDPRSADFSDPTVLGKIGVLREPFRAALSSSISVRLWGCAAWRRNRHFVRCYWNVYEGKRHISCGHKPEEIDRYRQEKDSGSKNVTPIALYIDKMIDSFAYELADAIGRPVWAAPIGYGTGSYGKTYKGDWPIAQNDLWLRPNPEVIDDDLLRKFIEDRLKLRMDSAGYVAYHHKMFDKYWQSIYKSGTNIR